MQLCACPLDGVEGGARGIPLALIWESLINIRLPHLP